MGDVEIQGKQKEMGRDNNATVGALMAVMQHILYRHNKW